MTEPATPVIKWVGGKTRLLPELVRRIPPTFGRYFEPFAGGGALFFKLAPDDAVLSDANADLINLYKVLARDPEPVIRRLRHHRRLHTKSYYYAVRERWNAGTLHARSALHVPAARAAAFVYLNKTCFNGIHRVNKAGNFNVPIGKQTNPGICMPDELRAAGAALARASIRCGDYHDAVASATAGDLVYFDSPYDPISKTSNFVGYSASGFTRDDQRKLADLARDLVRRGCHVMLSNNDTRHVRSLYKGFKIERVMCGRSINSDPKKRGVVAELIITGGPR